MMLGKNGAHTPAFQINLKKALLYKGILEHLKAKLSSEEQRNNINQSLVLLHQVLS